MQKTNDMFVHYIYGPFYNNNDFNFAISPRSRSPSKWLQSGYLSLIRQARECESRSCANFGKFRGASLTLERLSSFPTQLLLSNCYLRFCALCPLCYRIPKPHSWMLSSLVSIQFEALLGTSLLQISVQPTSKPDPLSPSTMLVQFETHSPHILPRKGQVSLLQGGSLFFQRP